MNDPFAGSPHEPATLFLRLEGPLQSWGGRAIGRFRRTEQVPTKSGVIGLLGSALGLSRQQLNERLAELNSLTMLVRVDRAGHLEEDYQTVGAGIGNLAADGKVKKTATTGEFETIVSPREFLVDASFLVVLRGDSGLIDELATALRDPQWPLFLGRKRCVPGTRIFAGVADRLSLAEAICQDGPHDNSHVEPDKSPHIRVITDLVSQDEFHEIIGEPEREDDTVYQAAKSYVTDRLVRLEPPVHGGRIVLDFEIARPRSTTDRPAFNAPLFGLPGPERPSRGMSPDAKQRARGKSQQRCLFCRYEFDPRDLHAHHLTYIRRGRERVTEDDSSTAKDDLVVLCSECHAAVTMLEYQNGFGLKRIDPRLPEWHSRIRIAREAIRRQTSPSRPEVGAGRMPKIEAGGRLLELIQTTIPLKAGSSFPPDAPGNRWLANRQKIHQRLSMAFPSHGATYAAKGYGVTRDEGGFLFRIERGPTTSLIVRSRILPDWGKAFADAGWLVDRQIPCPQFVDLASLHTGLEMAFSLEANPVKRLRADGPEGRKGARVPLREEALAGWMNARAVASGFEIIDGSLLTTPLGRQSAHLRSAADRHWNSVEFTGRLCIVESEAFIEALRLGLGPAKAFGFGMLAVHARDC